MSLTFSATLHDASGRRAIFTGEWPGSESGLRFCWEEGNWGCDCNRREFLDCALGQESPEDGYPCGVGAVTLERLEVQA